MLLRTAVILAFIAIRASCQNDANYRDIKLFNIYYDPEKEQPEIYTNNGIIEEQRNFTKHRRVREISDSSGKAYLPICCEQGYLKKNECLTDISFPTPSLKIPPIYDANLKVSRKKVEDFERKQATPCPSGFDRLALQAPPQGKDIFYLLENGSIYLNAATLDYPDVWYDIDIYCWALKRVENETYTFPAVCFPYDDAEDEAGLSKTTILAPISMILSLPFLLATFVIYTILPELDTMHGATLRCYVACLFFAYICLSITQFGDQDVVYIADFCTSIAFVIHFAFLASFFWLNVMCFDIWWTFGGFRSLQGSVKQRERKKFIIYSAYAWGSASLLTGVCLIMDFVPGIPTSFIKPEFGVRSCWFSNDMARGIYFYAPMGITVLCNICLFVSTAVKIIQHKKDTAHHLKGMDSRRHDDNKQWFNLYLKLFIVMGINWSMEIISWIFKGSPDYLWYITDLANTLQGVIIFVIFVWKDKIKRLLVKRLRCPNRSYQWRNSTRSGFHSSASRTPTTTATMAPLHEHVNPFPDRAKALTDESHGV